MTLKILYPDAQFDGEPTAEAKVFGPRASLTIHRPREAIAEATWRSCDAIVCYHDVDIGEAIVDLVAMPHGSRPFRVHIDPSDDGATIVNGVADRVRAQLMERIGLADLLHPKA